MSGAHFTAAIAWCAEQLESAGLRGSANPAKVNTPGVWIQIANARGINLDGGWEVDVNLYAVVGNVNPEQAFAELDKLVDELGVFTLRGELEVVTLNLPQQAGLPAVRYPIRVHTP